MPKLAKNYYRKANGEKRINCYMANIPKEIVRKSGIEGDDEIAVYEWYGEIIIKKRWHCTCMECDTEWDSGKDYGVCDECPRCHCGDIKYEENSEINDY
ncbi:MAG: AbrB/MazE/SpoVT family DNA-binding domain-containing protein [Romboutsia sp.]|nr:AbrB/MazE/SpoVT family DNA-binding domain-containing protein [Romboutsia sp.]